jgi:hypothetical protein
MANNDAIAVVISSGLSLLGLVWLYLWPYRDYRRDLFRARLFAIRGELFDGAADGKIDFNHPAYGLLRSTLNGFLRFGHRFGALRLVAMALVVDQDRFSEDFDFDRRWREAARTLTGEQRVWLQGLRQDMHTALFKHIVVTSVAGCFLFMLVVERRSNRAERKAAARRAAAKGLQPTTRGRLTARIDSVALANNYQHLKAAA